LHVDLLHRCRERQERYAAGLLDGRRQPALMARAVAGDPARNDLAAVGDEVSKDARVFVVDAQPLFGAEATNLTSSGSASTRAAIVSSA
jgi:hypothetical protein